MASGFGSFGSFSSRDSDIDTLVELARMRGGNVAEAVEELVHPDTSILSTIGDGFKNAFKGFVDVISTPSQIVAGVISSQKTIAEAMKEDLRPSDIIFGDRDKNMSTMQKVGDFSVRTATDILLDPLTYVTFGAGNGALFGARAVNKITLADDKVGVLTKAGDETLDYLRKVERQAKGLESALAHGGDEAAKMLPERLKTFKELKALEETGTIPKEVIEMGDQELKRLLRDTVDAPLNREFAKTAMANVLKANPALAETLLDKGGIKFFGKSILSGQRIQSVTTLIPGVSWLDSVTQQSRLAVSGLFDPSVIKGADQKYYRMPPEWVDFQRQVTDMSGYMQEERVKELGNIIKANNLAADEGKLLMASVEAGKIPADARLAQAYKQLMGFNKRELELLRERGVRISRLDRHAPHVLVSSGIKLTPFKLPPSEKVGAAMKRNLEGTIFKTDAESLKSLEDAVLSKNKKIIEETAMKLKNDGFEIFDDNLLSASVIRTVDNVRAGSMKQFIDSLARNFAVKADEAPAGYVGLNLTKFKNAEDLLVKQGMEENALRFHPAIAKRIEEFTAAIYSDDSAGDFLKAYDRIQNIWKASVTSIFPAFHGRNAISNVFLNYNDIGLESINPATQAMTYKMFDLDFKINGLARKAFSGGDEGVKATEEMAEIMMKPIFTDNRGHKWSFGELRHVMKANNIALRDDILGQIDMTKTSDELLDSIMPSTKLRTANKVLNPFAKNFKPFEWGYKVGSIVEGNARMVNFITNLRKTGDVGLAAARTKQFLFDYKYLTPFERNVMRRVIPFYSFMRKNLETQVDTLLRAPGRTAQQLTALTTLGDTIAGGSLTPEEEAALPAWIRDGIGILSSKDGQSVEILGSLGTPIEAVFQTSKPNVLLSSITPLVRLPVEIGSGYSFFHGKALSEVTNAAAFRMAPEAIKDYIKYTEVEFKTKDGEKVTWSVALRPERMHFLLNMPPTSRVLSAIKQMDSEDVSEQNKTLQFLLGIRPFAFDLELESAKREKELKDKIETVLSEAGIGYEFKKFIPNKQQPTLSQ